MLVLTMRLHDKVYIGDDIVIELLPAQQGHVRIGFIAPREIEILREKVKREQDEKRGLT
jgi:carbon storage regulator CsrA